MQYGMHSNLLVSSLRRNITWGWSGIAVMAAAAAFILHRQGITSLSAVRVLAGDAMNAASREPMPFVIGGVFLLVFLFIIGRLVVDTVSVLRFGLARLQMDPYPGSIGGDLGGSFLLNYRLKPQDSILVTAVCWRHYVSRSGGKSQSRQQRYWSEELRPEAVQQGGLLQLRFTFSLPEELPPAGKRENDRISWEVKLRITRKGRDILRSFQVPVTAGESPRHAARPMRHDLPQASQEFDGVAIVDSPGQLEIRGLPGRNSGMNAVLGIVGLVFAGSGVFLAYGVAWKNWLEVFSDAESFARIVSLAFALVTSVMALPFSGLGLLLLFMAIASSRNVRGLRIEGGKLVTGNRGRRDSMAIQDVVRFEISESGSMGTLVMHDVHAVGEGGRELKVLDAIPGKLAAAGISELLEKHAGKPVEQVGKTRRRLLRRRQA